MTDWTSLVSVGGTGLRPGDCRSMASRFCTVALLFPSLYISPLSFLLTFLLLLRATTVPFRRGNVADSRPREIASRTVVFQCLIREGARAQEDDRRRRLVAKLDDETLFSLFYFQLDSRTRKGWGTE